MLCDSLVNKERKQKINQIKEEFGDSNILLFLQKIEEI